MREQCVGCAVRRPSLPCLIDCLVAACLGVGCARLLCGSLACGFSFPLFRHSCRLCRVGLVSPAAQMFYEMFFSISALVALVMMGLGAHRQRYTAGMYKAHAIATVAAVTALFNWALCPHLILTSELHAIEQLYGLTGSLGFGPSWGLLIPIFIFALGLGMFWRAVVETLPAVTPGSTGAVPAAGGVPAASPQQFSDPAMPLEQNPYLAAQQQSQQQAQFAPQMQQQYPAVAIPAAYASQYPAVQPGMEQQGMGAGYVAPEASTGGFAQI